MTEATGAGDAAGRRPETAGTHEAGADDAAADLDNRALIDRLDAFLDEQAVGHRKAMEEVVSWLWRTGDLESEIHRSVASLGAIFQKWSFEILFLLRMRGTMRFTQLKEELASVGPESIGKKLKEAAGVGSRTLSQRLKDLEQQGLIEREVFPEVPLRVEYSLTPKGMRFGDLIMPVIAHLRITEVRERHRAD